MAYDRPRKAATAGFVSGFMTVTVFLLVFAALSLGLGPIETGPSVVPHSRIGAGR